MMNKVNNITVRLAALTDAEDIAAIHRQVFVRQKHSLSWIKAGLSAYPRLMTYVLLIENDIVGYAVWAQKSGFRDRVVLELDQIAVYNNRQRQGLGRELIQQSLVQVEHDLNRHGQTLKALWVNTAADNPAQKLYQEVLGVQTVAKLEGLYSQPEMIMLNIMRENHVYPHE